VYNGVMNSEQCKAAAEPLRRLAEAIEAGKYESVDISFHAPIRDATPPTASAARFEHTGSEVITLKLQRASDVAQGDG
jgi:hypothetical protein